MGRRPQARRGEPAAQGAFVRQRLRWQLRGEFGANQFRSPARMGPAQGKRGGHHGRIMARPPRATGSVVRRQPGHPTVAIAPPDGAHRAPGQPQLGGDLRQRDPGAVASDDAFTIDKGDGTGHGHSPGVAAGAILPPRQGSKLYSRQHLLRPIGRRPISVAGWTELWSSGPPGAASSAPTGGRANQSRRRWRQQQESGCNDD
jgi:hypothetical protein